MDGFSKLLVVNVTVLDGETLRRKMFFVRRELFRRKMSVLGSPNLQTEEFGRLSLQEVALEDFHRAYHVGVI